MHKYGLNFCTTTTYTTEHCKYMYTYLHEYVFRMYDLCFRWVYMLGISRSWCLLLVYLLCQSWCIFIGPPKGSTLAKTGAYGQTPYINIVTFLCLGICVFLCICKYNIWCLLWRLGFKNTIFYVSRLSRPEYYKIVVRNQVCHQFVLASRRWKYFRFFSRVLFVLSLRFRPRSYVLLCDSLRKRHLIIFEVCFEYCEKKYLNLTCIHFRTNHQTFWNTVTTPKD